MASKQGTNVKSGTTEVTTAQTAVRLVATTEVLTCVGVWVSADPNNTGKCAVGDKNVNAKATLGTFKGLLLDKEGKQTYFIEVTDPSTLWVDAEKSKDFVNWTAVLA